MFRKLQIAGRILTDFFLLFMRGGHCRILTEKKKVKGYKLAMELGSK
jgi:hypothetical protein